MRTIDGRQRMSERLSLFSLFNEAEYAALHSDLKEKFTEHYIEYGLWEGRPFAGSARIARTLGAAQNWGEQLGHSTEDELAAVLRASGRLDVGVFASSRGNFYMTEIADLMADGLRRIGVKAVRRDETSSIHGRPRHCIFVAPHEFFTLGCGADWNRDDVLMRGFAFSTEQIQTPWFRTALPYILLSHGVIDLNYQTHEVFKSTGMPALFYFPGFEPNSEYYTQLPNHPLARALSTAALNYDVTRDLWRERPIDVVFLGAESPIREEFFARNASFFAERSCFFHYVRLTGVRTGPLIAEQNDARPALNSYLGRRSKIVLNLHQGSIGYFEWHRIVAQGIWHRALVISDPCLPHPVFTAGVHYLEETPRRIPKLIDWLIRSADGQVTAERVRHAAYMAAVEYCSKREMSLRLASFLLQHSTVL